LLVVRINQSPSEILLSRQNALQYNSSMFPEVNEKIGEELSSQLGNGWPSRFAHWLCGPGNLGCHVGFVGAVAVWFLLNHMEVEVFPLICVGVLGYIGGMGGVFARDEFLREDWARFRPLVGLVTGTLIGAVGGLLFLSANGWIPFAAGIGGGIGGLTDAFVHHKILESDW
jgi:hypothetical protein